MKYIKLSTTVTTAVHNTPLVMPSLLYDCMCNQFCVSEPFSSISWRGGNITEIHFLVHAILFSNKTSWVLVCFAIGVITYYRSTNPTLVSLFHPSLTFSIPYLPFIPDSLITRLFTRLTLTSPQHLFLPFNQKPSQPGL